MEPKELLLICRPVFKEFLRRSGNGGTSIGITKNGKADYLGIGIESTEIAMPDEDTVHLISSMTKPILAVGIGILVASGKIELETLVTDILPLQNALCRHRNGAPLRVCDLLDHRSEFYRCDRLWEGHDGRINIHGDDSILRLYECLPLNGEYNDESKYHNSRNSYQPQLLAIGNDH
ncbi:beta-lactamase/transpeptidase-like protein [Diaporthe sp. PMI_573]|nr:beta-lactamase/transpeptidase-like protein [Diaporthaceae sp. PMI_573]